MIKGIGFDIVEIDRLSRVLSRQPRLPERILTLSEQDVFRTLSEKDSWNFWQGALRQRKLSLKHTEQESVSI